MKSARVKFFISVFLIQMFLVIPLLAQRTHSTENLLMIFSGSDWCPSCMRFEKFILSDSAFIRYAAENLEISLVDFPQRKKLDQAIIKQNELLAEKYNPRGLFPTIILFSGQTDKFVRLPYTNQNTADFIELIEQKKQELLK